ncbi:MAG: PAS domain-containing protein [Spirochaetales bacterium]|nr:PAS domain-containing protein [Spirochaetales bacterium]
MSIILLSALVVAAVSSGFLSVYAARRSNTHHSNTLSAMLALLMLWSAAYFLQLVLPGVGLKLLFSNITFVFIPFVPVLWFVFSMQYAGYEQKVTAKNMWPLFCIPVGVQFGIWTDAHLHWFRDGVILETQGPITNIVIDYSHIFWIHATYSYLLLFLGVFFIIRKVINTPQVPVTQALLLLGACFIPFAVNMVYLFVRGTTSDIVDWTPVSLSASGIMLSYATLKFRLLEPSPVAYTYLFESMNEGILVLDHENTVIDANPAAALLLSVPLHMMIGMDAMSIPVFEQDRDMLSESKSLRILSFEARGRLRHYEVTVQNFELEYEKRQGKLVTLRDITYRKRLEDEVARSQKYESLEMFAGGLAHDFNNMLSIILGNVSLAKDECAGRDELTYLNDIEEACDRARRLTHQLMAFARGEKVKLSECHLGEIVSRVAALFLSGRRIVLDNHLSADLGPVKADEKQMETVFQNLILNAVEAMGKNGFIVVEGEIVEFDGAGTVGNLPKGRYVKVTVQDSGPGIDEENLLKVFDPYFTTKQEGHGLGLSLVYSIVSRHGGDIRAESNQHGARFTIYLPSA